MEARQPEQDLSKEMIKLMVFLVFHYTECENDYEAISFRMMFVLQTFVAYQANRRSCFLTTKTKTAYAVNVFMFSCFSSF